MRRSKPIDLGIEKYKCTKTPDGKHTFDILEEMNPIAKVKCIYCNDVFEIRKKKK